jgi:5-methylcytosine-specific restriction endonuclease McrA
LKTLVLNASMQPLHVVSWESAMKMVFLQKVDIIDSYNKTIKTVSQILKAPKIIRYKRYYYNIQHDLMVYSRRNLIIRDHSTCQYCATVLLKKNVTIDHIIPKSKGGKLTWQNTVVACKKCNGLKENKPLSKSGLKLLKQPKVPSVEELFEYLQSQFTSPDI